MKVEVEVIGLELQMKLTQLELGISLLPKNLVATEIRQGGLKALSVKGTKLQSYFCLVFRKDKYIHSAIKAFLKIPEDTLNLPTNCLRKYLEPGKRFP